jgi:hypothetical protein
MPPIETNPFAVLTFIAAPAVLTSASAVMGLQIGNRFSRTVDRTRALGALLETLEGRDDEEARLRLRQFDYTERRVLLLARALTAIHLSVGCYGGTALASLLGAITALSGVGVLQHIVLGLALLVGVTATAALLTVCGLVVAETRLAFRSLFEENQFVRRRHREAIDAALRQEGPGLPPVLPKLPPE